MYLVKTFSQDTWKGFRHRKTFSQDYVVGCKEAEASRDVCLQASTDKWPKVLLKGLLATICLAQVCFHYLSFLI